MPEVEAATILLVDDEPGVRMTLAANLELEGFTVSEAASVFEAIELLTHNRFDLLISDVRMPGLDGVAGLERLRAIQPELPAILVTGYDADSMVTQAISKGAFTVLAKPILAATLVGVVRSCLAGPVVLVVDDEAPFRETLVEGLRLAGLQVERAANGQEALAQVERAHVDVCILDLVMPGRDGAQVFADLIEQNPNIRVIAMTGHEVGALVRSVIDSGAIHCLTKPFQMNLLTQLIGRARAQNGSLGAREGNP